jgi:hypothetical protein
MPARRHERAPRDDAQPFGTRRPKCRLDQNLTAMMTVERILDAMGARSRRPVVSRLWLQRHGDSVKFVEVGL